MATLDSLPELIQALHNPLLYPHPAKNIRLLETHISWVLLAGRYAYKIKKPVDFGFLDFSAPARRRFYCEEEIRLNRRLAPGLYLDVVAIGGEPGRPVFGGEPAFEYAVKMRRFSTRKTLDALLQRGGLQTGHIDSLAETIAIFHAALPATDAGSDFGVADNVLAPALDNFHQLAALLASEAGESLMTLRRACEAEFSRCQALFAQRREQGMIRECHGDLHLGNIVLLRGKPTPFDGIEFNPDLRWIDTVSDIAFLLMDLRYRGRADLAYRFLDAYLQHTGDYAGCGVLRFYLAYRAMVKAKVNALRAHQGDTMAVNACHDYLRLATRMVAERGPALIVTHGLPGCGKTTVSQWLLEKFGAIRLRSDVERKRLFGLGARQSSQSQAEHGIYTQDATETTYRRLLALSRQILLSGFPVIVDAAFLKRQERQQFQRLADELELPFAIVDVHADEGLLTQRLAQRQRENRDASEAGVEVYTLLKAVAEPLAGDEKPFTVEVVNNLDGFGQSNLAFCEKLKRITGLADIG